MPELSLNDWLAYGTLAGLFLIFIISYFIARAKAAQNKASAKENTRLDAILHRSSERGEGVLVGTSEGAGAQVGSLAGLAGLQTQAHVFRHSLHSDLPPKTVAGDGNLVALSQQLNAGIYHTADMPELYKLDSSGLAGIGSYAYLAGLIPELSRPNLSALLMQGELSPELILALDAAKRHDLDAIMASSSLSGQAAAHFIDPQSALGEEAFMSQSTRPREKAGLKATLICLRIARGLIIAGLLVAILLQLLGVLP
ncbi:MAG TPA: hypothetical protein PK791_05395 [Anaerolineaceae bacterium]|jgi:hypothetical protein|nr:hypothetical protein [Anaerolineaceae bacterium]HOH92783.1 hypothetical protein [Anaerolineaceae bacterium]HQL92924.1 hypothetical protein [Anaerolineaceae bacterium]HQN68603.1 hypothetical protein [Anaerolineaceae bacterium]